MPTLTPIDGDPFAPAQQPTVALTEVEHNPFDPLAASAGVAPAGTPRIDQIDWGQPSWTEQAAEQSRRDQEAYARGGVPEMLRDTQATQDLAGGFGGGAIAGTTRAAVVRNIADTLAEELPNVGRRGRGIVGSGSLEQAPPAASPSSADEALGHADALAGGRRPLEGLPQQVINTPTGPYVPGPVGYLHDLAEDYMTKAGLLYNPPRMYAKVDPKRAQAIAKAFDEMPHAPSDPAVKASYDAMINETVAQYRSLKDSGIKFEFIPEGAPDPYASNPRLAAQDVANNKHLWVFPTESGFGTQTKITDNPLLRTIPGETISGKPATANDIFRIVHDIYGHFKEGNGFRAGGEENAWRAHSAMYSDAARPAMTSETRGQNSWVNYGPHGETNRTASGADTVYADQKIGLLPDWAINEGRHEGPQAGPSWMHQPNATVSMQEAQHPTLSDYLSDPSAHINRFGMPVKGSGFSKAAEEAWANTNIMPRGYGPLDLSLHHVQPNVPQVPLQRYDPPRGVTARLTDAMNNPEVVNGMLHAIENGVKLGAHWWYHTEPIRQAFENEFGRNNWQKPFKLFMDLQAAASPRSDVSTQIRNGSWMYAHAINGRPLPPAGPGNYPYGHIGGRLHRINFGEVTGPGWDVIAHPKPPSFSENFQGNFEPGTMDTHATRLPGMLSRDPRFLQTSSVELVPETRELGPDAAASKYGEYIGKKVDEHTGKIFHKYVYRPQRLFRDGHLTIDEALKIPPFWVGKPNSNEYAALENFYKELGRRHFGLPTASTQAAAWAGGGELTGLGTAADMTFPQLMNQRIMYTAHMRGEDPHNVLRAAIRGTKPLLGIAGVGMAFPHLWGDLEDPHQ
jgi:hypothetical protein